MRTSLLRSLFVAVVLLILGALASSPGFAPSERWNQRAIPVSLRLPNDTRPVSYDIHIKSRVDQGDLNFVGHVKIVVEVLNATSEIVLHARQLEIKSIGLKTAYYVPEAVATTYSYDNVTEFLTITATENALKPMYYYLTIEYAGELRQDNGGFYLSTYRDENNNLIKIGTTTFEATDARHAFPCYDEPAKKAVYKLKIRHGSEYNAISNMPIIEGPNNNEDGTSTTTFQQTTVMSTYLLAFVISNFQYSELQGKIPHRVYSRLETKPEHNFPLVASVRILEAFEDYVNVSYKLPKLDNVAIPDFPSGAMENWGIVTYREEALLFNDLKSTTLTQGNIVGNIAHEFAHQWFGNLVSPFWWTFLWLNEGFATMLCYVAAEAVFPNWELWQRYHVELYDVALEADSKANPRPMTHYVESPSEINTVFDAVSYVKGASFLNMVRHAFSDETFRKAINYYLQEMEYSAAEEDDLFRNFQKAIDGSKQVRSIDIAKTFKSWTNQGGFPLLTVTRNYNEGTFVVEQSPFDGTNKKINADRRSWWVPLNFATANNPDYSDTTMYDFLSIGEKSKKITPNPKSALSKEDWLILNKKSTSFYRINYDLNNWKLLTSALNSNLNQFHVLNRAQLLDDAFAFVRSKHLNITTLLNLSLYLKNEKQYAPWAKMNLILTRLYQYLNGDPSYDLLQYYVGKIIGNFYSKVEIAELSSEEHLTKLTRNLVVTWACRANYGDCLKVTRDKFQEFVRTGQGVQPNMMSSIFCFGLKKADRAEYEFLFKQIKISKDPAFRRSLVSNVMGCMENVTLLQDYLGSSIRFDDSNNYELEERTNVLPSVVSMGSVQFEAVINFLTASHKKYSKIPALYRIPPLVSAMKSIAARVVSQHQKAQFEDLLRTLGEYKEIQEAREALLTTVKANLEWMADYRKDLVEWLSDFKTVEEGGGGDGSSKSTLSAVALLFLIVVSLNYH